MQKMFKKKLTRAVKFENLLSHTEQTKATMRTKTLLLTAVLGAVGVASALAQTPVFSLNAVGYVNVAIPAGFSIIANPLNAATNNLNSILSGQADGTTIYAFNNTTGVYDVSQSFGGAWFPDAVLGPGDGAFIQVSAATTVTFVGEVPQGALTTHIPSGFSIKSMLTPLSISLADASVHFPEADGDTIYSFNNGSGVYDVFQFFGGSLIPDYAPAVGQGFFVQKAAAADWNLSFSVNN